MSQYNVLGRLVIHISGATGFDYPHIHTTEANGFLDPVKISTQFLSVNSLSPASYENRKWKSPHINNISVAVQMESLMLSCVVCTKASFPASLTPNFVNLNSGLSREVKKRCYYVWL